MNPLSNPPYFPIPQFFGVSLNVLKTVSLFTVNELFLDDLNINFLYLLLFILMVLPILFQMIILSVS